MCCPPSWTLLGVYVTGEGESLNSGRRELEVRVRECLGPRDTARWALGVATALTWGNVPQPTQDVLSSRIAHWDIPHSNMYSGSLGE